LESIVIEVSKISLITTAASFAFFRNAK